VAEHGNHAERFEETRRRRDEAVEREAADDAKREEALADEFIQRAERLEREAVEIETSDAQQAADLRQAAALDRDSARDIALASEIAQERAEDERPFGPRSDRDEGGEA
jgi:hypothetical protein